MAGSKQMRLSKVLRELNISKDRALEYLKKNGIELTDTNPNVKIDESVYNTLSSGFQADKSKKEASNEVGEEKRREKEAIRVEREKGLEEKREQKEREKLIADLEKEEAEARKAKEEEKERLRLQKEIEAERKKTEVMKGEAKPIAKPKQVGKIDLEPKKKKKAVNTEIEKASQQAVSKPVPAKDKKDSKPKVEEKEATADQEAAKLETNYAKLSGPKLTGEKIDLSQFNKPKKKDPKKEAANNPNKKRRRRIKKAVDPSKAQNQQGGAKGTPGKPGQGGAAKPGQRGPGGPGQRGPGGPGQRGPGGANANKKRQ